MEWMCDIVDLVPHELPYCLLDARSYLIIDRYRLSIVYVERCIGKELACTGERREV